MENNNIKNKISFKWQEKKVCSECITKKIFKNKHLVYMQIIVYIHTNLHNIITISNIAEKFNLSERTLRNYFHEELGISPKQYLTRIRLQRVRDILLGKKENFINIEQTARKFGFNHLGQFSATYKELFNELPSDTLHNNRVKLFKSF